MECKKIEICKLFIYIFNQAARMNSDTKENWDDEDVEVAEIHQEEYNDDDIIKIITSEEMRKQTEDYNVDDDSNFDYDKGRWGIEDYEFYEDKNKWGIEDYDEGKCQWGSKNSNPRYEDSEDDDAFDDELEQYDKKLGLYMALR
jgi:hypothetical protein